VRWFIPNLGLAVTIAATCYCLFLFDSPRRLFGDPDPGWHIRAGEWILRAGAVPRTDPFSFLETGKPWYAFEWGAEVIMALIHRAVGIPGIAFFFTMAISTSIWLWFRLHRVLGGNFLLSCLMASPLVATIQTHWLARPHVLSHVLMLAALLYFETAPARFRLRDGILITAGAALWANLHGSFPILIVLAVFYAAGYWLKPVLWRDTELLSDRARARWYGLAALCALLGTLVNPYGLRLHQHVVTFTVSPELRPLIAEWRAFDFAGLFGLQPAIVVVLASAGGLLALRQRRVHHFLIAVLLVAFALQASRGLSILALAGLPLANAALTDWLRTMGRKGSATLRRFFTFSAQLADFDTHFSGAALVPILALAVFLWFRVPAVAARTGFSQDLYPVRAAAVIDNLPASSRLFASLAHGGYLIYRLEGRRKIFVDGRIDYYGPEPHLDAIRMLRARVGWEKLIEKYRFTHVLVENSHPLSAALEKSGWKLLHSDPLARLYEKP
jgi:hypothetical protein